MPFHCLRSFISLSSVPSSAPIQPLPTAVVHQIAAGEVIDSLAAAVRELIDNAIDAGATHLTLTVWPDQWQVQLADNGSGLPYADLPLAAQPHTTSKIRTAPDLDRIQTLGFRGQALASLAQLGQLTVCSRRANQDGWQATYTPQGHLATLTAVGMAPGTVVTVGDLFGRWSARRQGQPRTTHQLRHIQRTVYSAALCHPHLTWQVQLGDRPWFKLTPGTTAAALIPQLLPRVQPTDLVSHCGPLAPPSADSAPAQLSLVLGLPDRCHRPRPDWLKVAVNGRLVSGTELEPAILGALRHTVPRQRYPLVVAHLHLDSRHIDWHRSPDKATIHLHHSVHWQTQLTAALDHLLQAHPPSLPNARQQRQIIQLVQAAETQGTYRAGPASLSDPLPNPAPLKVLAQVHNRYILAERPEGICLIEQHIAHERVIYERLQQHWHLVDLAEPVVLADLTASQRDQLAGLGLAPEPFGPQRWAVRQVPAALAQRQDVAAALVELSQGDLAAAQVAVACRTAIRNGTPLSHQAMVTLVQQWQRTRRPHTCPHGRPICLTLNETSLARFFRRSWVVGKSHGIEEGNPPRERAD